MHCCEKQSSKRSFIFPLAKEGIVKLYISLEICLSLKIVLIWRETDNDDRHCVQDRVGELQSNHLTCSGLGLGL